MNSGDQKTYKYVKISRSNFFMITILSLRSICSESKKAVSEMNQKEERVHWKMFKEFTQCNIAWNYMTIVTKLNGKFTFYYKIIPVHSLDLMWSIEHMGCSINFYEFFKNSKPMPNWCTVLWLIALDFSRRRIFLTE